MDPTQANHSRLMSAALAAETDAKKIALIGKVKNTLLADANVFSTERDTFSAEIRTDCANLRNRLQKIGDHQEAIREGQEAIREGQEAAQEKLERFGEGVDELTIEVEKTGKRLVNLRVMTSEVRKEQEELIKKLDNLESFSSYQRNIPAEAPPPEDELPELEEIGAREERRRCCLVEWFCNICKAIREWWASLWN